MNASPDAVPQLSKEAINELPMLAYEGEVLLVQTEGELSRALYQRAAAITQRSESLNQRIQLVAASNNE